MQIYRIGLVSHCKFLNSLRISLALWLYSLKVSLALWLNSLRISLALWLQVVDVLAGDAFAGDEDEAMEEEEDAPLTDDQVCSKVQHGLGRLRTLLAHCLCFHSCRT